MRMRSQRVRFGPSMPSPFAKRQPSNVKLAGWEAARSSTQDPRHSRDQVRDSRLKVFLACCAMRLGLSETSATFDTTWDHVRNAVVYAVRWGLAHRKTWLSHTMGRGAITSWASRFATRRSLAGDESPGRPPSSCLQHGLSADRYSGVSRAPQPKSFFVSADGRLRPDPQPSGQSLLGELITHGATMLISLTTVRSAFTFKGSRN